MKKIAGWAAFLVLLLSLWIFRDPLNGWLEAHKLTVLEWTGIAVACYLVSRIDLLEERMKAAEWNLGRREAEVASLKSEMHWLANQLGELKDMTGA